MQDKLLRLVLVSLQQQGKGTFSFLNDGMSIFTVIIIWISKNFLWKKQKTKKKLNDFHLNMYSIQNNC